MKRIVSGLGIFLCIAALAVSGIYLIRRDRAQNQLVHPDSSAVLSVYVDDFLIDHIGELLNRQLEEPADRDNRKLDVEHWWNAGIGIPARLHFFSLEDPTTWYSLLKIKNRSKWEQFLNHPKADSILLAGQTLFFASGKSAQNLPSNTSVLYNDQYVLIRLSLSDGDSIQAMPSIWAEKEGWTALRNLKLQEPKTPGTHLTYRQTDGTLTLSAHWSEERIDLSGKWHLPDEAPGEVRVRKSNSEADFLSFWTTLPLSRLPLILDLPWTATAVEKAKITAHTHEYIDLSISSNTTVQRDTVVTYDYDENFNPTEKKEVRETAVPLIESMWKGDGDLRSALPDKLFYNLYKTDWDSLVLLTTSDKPPALPAFIKTSSPLQLSIDFRQTPAALSHSVLISLQEQSVQLSVSTAKSDKNTLKITGSIRYNDL